jgi:DNA repair exonuclease SbcCD ATPase subunit
MSEPFRNPEQLTPPPTDLNTDFSSKIPAKIPADDFRCFYCNALLPEVSKMRFDLEVQILGHKRCLSMLREGVGLSADGTFYDEVLEVFTKQQKRIAELEGQHQKDVRTLGLCYEVQGGLGKRIAELEAESRTLRGGYADATIEANACAAKLEAKDRRIAELEAELTESNRLLSADARQIHALGEKVEELEADLKRNYETFRASLDKEQKRAATFEGALRWIAEGLWTESDMEKAALDALKEVEK